MSQEQPRRPQEAHADPIKYGDVFSGDLAQKPIAPQDAARMQTAEATVFGQVQGGGPASVMRGATELNERAGLVGGEVTDVTGDKDVTVTATDYPGARIVTESVAGQVVGQYFQTTQVQQTATVQSQITIGEALEAAARVCGDKPVDRSDAAAIQEAEGRATGSDVMTPGGVAATAHSAASFNAGVVRVEEKIKLSYVLADATVKLPADRVATREDADRVANAEQRNSPNLTTNPAGVAASVATAARLNEGA